ncbi:hypothetical protein GCM10009715_33480 [Paeniglutamicibacter psychrophenolicus]|uniref:Uncharacterized protein n=1 Tax=Paeniglutamicibacter psychrophenolicus TaxID=257454 RepID=A0ABS4W9R3_9MICC|nr:hypothetical protein [Paeniglutamicibacter psychrophenolicus]MBP2372935.1 hypothetical protein [Paeniglutamicibacter psychrophenolicus]
MSLPENNIAPEPKPLVDTLKEQRNAAPGTGTRAIKMFDADAYRAIVWILVAAIAVIVWFSTPAVSDPGAGKIGMTSAKVIKAGNDANTQGAPQQQVVNGWYVADALPVISDQIAGVHTAVANNRFPALALVFGLGFCIDVVGRSFGAIRNRRVAAESRVEGTALTI